MSESAEQCVVDIPRCSICRTTHGYNKIVDDFTGYGRIILIPVFFLVVLFAAFGLADRSERGY